jgi:hypothetical protein
MEFSNLKHNIYNKKHIKNKSNIFHIKKKSTKSIEFFAYQNFIKKYKSMPFNYNIYITNNIIFNDRTHLVSKFKEYLVVDDKGEFLKRFYKKSESLERLPKFFEFYFLYSKLFPNYTSLYENKILYNNIYQKQRMIDLQEKMEKEKKEIKMEIDVNFAGDKNFEIFSTDIINTLLNATTNKEGMELLFDVKNYKLTEEENNFNDGVNRILDKIDNYQNQINIQDINSINSNKNQNDIFIHFNSIYTKGNLNNINNINNNIMLRNNINNIILKNKENISHLSNNHNILLNLMSNKNKRTNKEHKKLKINYNINEIKKHIIKNRNKENKLKKYLSNKILNINDIGIAKNKSKTKKLNEKFLIGKIEKVLFKKKRFQNSKNYLSQNISTSIQSKKDLSLSKINNINQLNLNKNLKNQSLSTLIKINDIPYSKIRSTKLSSSNSFIKEIQNKKIQNNRLIGKKNETKSLKNFNMELNCNKNTISRNKNFQNSTTSTNIFNNIIKYINKKYIDSRNKTNNININTCSKINITNLTDKYLNNKINFNNSKNINEYETQNNKKLDLKNKIKNIFYDKKSNNNINSDRNYAILGKSIISKKSKSFKCLKQKKSSSMNSARNLFANSYKNIYIKKIDKKTIESYNFCESTRNFERKNNSKNKLAINCTHIKLNFKNRTKNNSKDNSYKKYLNK